MASYSRRYGKYLLLLSGAGLSSYAAFKLIDQKKEVHFKTEKKFKSINNKVKVRLFSLFILLLFQKYIVKASSQQTSIKPISTKALPSRTDQLKSLRETKEFDVLVIGGGATGCGVALDSITRGLIIGYFFQ